MTRFWQCQADKQVSTTFGAPQFAWAIANLKSGSVIVSIPPPMLEENGKKVSHHDFRLI
jgi:hypothetical protein